MDPTIDPSTGGSIEGQDTPHDRPDGGSTPQRSAALTVLILEDQPDDAELIVGALRHDGLACTWQRVETPEDYLAALATPPNIILADYHLPRFDAPRALALLQDSGLDIPFIVVTGTVGEEEAVACIKQGAADYLLKDRLGRLGSAVRHALAEQRLRAEKRQADAALEASEARYRAVSELTSDFAYSFVRTAEGRIVCEWLTGAGARIFGTTAEEINARGGWQTFLHPDDAELGRRHAQKLWAGQPDMLELRALTDSGETVWLRLHDRPVRDEGTGRVVRVMGAAQDITPYKAAGARIRFQARLLDTVGQAVIANDLTGRITYWNRAAEQLYGWTAAEVLGRPIQEVVTTPDDQAQEIAARTAAGQEWSGEGPRRHRDGRVFPIQLTTTPVFDQAGTVIGIVAVAMDVTTRHQMEQALAHERDLFQTLMDTMPDTIYFKDTASRFVRINQAEARLLGAATPEEAVGKTDFDYYPEDLARALFMRSSNRSCGRGSPPSTQLEEQVRSGLPTRWILSSKAPIVRTGQVTGLVGISRDITALRQAEEAQRRSEEQYRRIVETANEGIWLLDADQRISLRQRASGRAARLHC